MIRLILLAVGVVLLAAASAAGDGGVFTSLYVAPAGAEFSTVQSAIDAVPADTGQMYVIHVAPGTYHERINVPKNKTNIMLLGKDPNTTILTYDLRASSPGPDGRNVGTTGSSSTYISGNDFTAMNVTFANSAGNNVGQAVAIKTQADRLVFFNCRFTGWQDTLYANRGSGPGRQYFKNCYIDGDVDFIFGDARAYFEDCEIRSKEGGYVTAQSKKTPDVASGYVFRNCRLTRVDGVADASVDLGRPWRAYSTVVFVDCWMDSHIRPRGWNNWRDPNKEQTAFYAEHNSTGPGADPAGRVSWSRQLTVEQAEEFSKANWLGGEDDWVPSIPVIFPAPAREATSEAAPDATSSPTGDTMSSATSRKPPPPIDD